MNSIKSLLPGILACGISFTASAQHASEAILFSDVSTQGTARSMGFGNALGSVGGDFSSLSVNPAGIGIYKSSEFTFTPSVKANSASGEYIGNTTSDNNSRFNINSFGLVFTSTPQGRHAEKKGWKAISFAFGMNRVADFNHDYSFGGRNNTSSYTQSFEQDANQYLGNDSIAGTPAYIGWQSYLLNHDSTNGYSSVVPISGGINQLLNVKERGGINEFLISLGGNYKDKLMLGFTIGVPSFNYQRDALYQESVPSDNTTSNPSNFSSFTYNESLRLSGAGINLKLGAIYKFSDYFRAGLALHSPTYYSIHDEYNQSLTAVVGGNTYTESGDPNIPSSIYLPGNTFDYHVTTPWHAVASATAFIKNYGFITADYEYVDYSSVRYRYDQQYALDESELNQAIKNTYQAASVVRIGAEGRVTKNFMLRAGFGYYGSPYKQSNIDGSRIDLSAGLGFRFEHFFADLGLVHSMYQGGGQPYDVDYTFIKAEPAATVPLSKVDYNINNIALTIGYKL